MMLRLQSRVQHKFLLGNQHLNDQPVDNLLDFLKEFF